MPERLYHPEVVKLHEITMHLQERESIFQDAKETLARAWESSPIPMWIKDTKGVMVFLNDAYCSIYGIKKTDYLGKTDEYIWGSKTAEHYKKLDDKVLHGGRVEYSIEDVPNEYKATQFDKCHVIKYPIYNDVGDIVGIAGMITGVFP